MPTSEASRRLAWAAAFAVLGAGAAALASRRRAEAPARMPLAAVAPGALVRLEGRQNGETLTLLKHAGSWTAGGAGADGPAKPELCQALAYGAERVALGPKISDDPGSYDSYGLSDARATRLRVFAEGAAAPALELYLGSPAYGEALYARLADEAPVYVETGIPADVLLLPATGFLLKP